MPLKLLPSTPMIALNAAFMKVRPLRLDFDLFKANLIKLLDKVDESEREENQKNHVRDFLVNTYYAGKREVNTKGTIDLVIHTEQSNKSPVGVIIETKRPSNKSEWISAEKPNSKAFQELVLYYMRERIEERNIDVKQIIITNIYEWYIIDAVHFEKIFYGNNKFVKAYESWRDGQKVTSDTNLFYSDIAKPFIDEIDDQIPCTYFDIRHYEHELRNADKDDDSRLIELYKLLSEYHLLRVPFANDSNSLDKRFYTELLHIIGLTETKEGSKKLIGRHIEGQRHSGTILEDAIIQIEAVDKLSRIKNLSQYGSTKDERLFNVALELSITWINRILFLKLLEGQLVTYHRGDKSYLFLNTKTIREYDDLNTIFFQVLAKNHDARNADVKSIFAKVPYLNSSLFEPTELEQETILISNLRDEKTMPIYSQTVLKDANGQKRTGTIRSLQYLFEFLDAYDFASEGTGAIQEDNKTLINASVLGLIFEKINGYKDGSFFTPGFITMYMCRETIRRAVVQKFNEAKSWACGDIIDLYNKIEDRTEANNIINSIKICDPAVGSGHFLVSALNEMIAIKSDLHILQDKNGRLLRGYRVEVINDELSIRDEEGYLYAYNPRNAESQRIQETLFHEKETIIESCLFGVDINPNSVKICRLRLWIELLKNAYYKAPNILETLPNIDINIKCGNSLISRFALDVDMSEVFKKKETTVQKYLLAVQAYKDTNDKDAKAETKAFIDKLKAEFTTTLYARDPKKVEMSKLRGRISLIDNAAEIGDLFGKLDDVNIIKDREKLQKQLDKLEAEVAEQQSGKFFDDANAFEWRFEFPEVLNDEGDFVGFDVVIGNPPYGAELYDSIKVFLKEKYTLYHTRWTDTFNYFIGHGIDISKDSANVCLIIPNNFLFQTEYEKSRRKVIEQHKIIKVINLGDGIFLDAEVPTCIILFSKNNHINNLVKYTDLRRENKNENIFLNANYVNSYRDEILSSSSVSFSIDKIGTTIIKRNIDSIITIDTIAEEVANGIQPTGDKIFRLSPDKVVDLGIEPAILKKVLTGSDFHKYVINETNYKIIYTNKDVDITKYPKCLSYLNQFKEQLSKKRETLKGTLPWWSLHWPRYSGLFEEEKIIFRQTSDTIICSYDNDGYYVMNTVLVLKVKQEYKKLLPYKYLLGILNSRLINYFYKQITQEENRVFAEVKPINIRKLPILKASYHQQQQLISLVDLILSSKKHNNLLDTTDLETQIDQLVYELYGLTEGEIRIVEGNG